MCIFPCRYAHIGACSLRKNLVTKNCNIQVTRTALVLEAASFFPRILSSHRLDNILRDKVTELYARYPRSRMYN